MKFVEMLTCPEQCLRDHYASCRELAYNAMRIAQHGRRSARKMVGQVGYLMRQIEMAESAARRRRMSLV